MVYFGVISFEEPEPVRYMGRHKKLQPATNPAAKALEGNFTFVPLLGLPTVKLRCSVVVHVEGETLQQRGERRAGQEALQCFEQAAVRLGALQDYHV